ncbi:hypothetical protein [Caballeronia terrestris]|nr:hypothetical protein [Caballeronia terrestris]
MKRFSLSAVFCLGLTLLQVSTALARDDMTPLLPPASVTSSTVPPNGDVNPYGVAFVPEGFPAYGTIGPRDLLVANFNKANLQGTGTTIVKMIPNGDPVVFFQGTGLGLTTALGVLKGGFVVVGNVLTTDGTFGTIKAGSLLVLNQTGTIERRQGVRF